MTQTLPPELLAILVCPESRQKLKEADVAQLTKLNEGIAAGQLRNRAGEVLEATLTGALVREDGAIAYPVIDQIPDLLIEHGIELE